MKVSFKQLSYLILTICLLLGTGTMGYAQEYDSLVGSQAPVEVRLPDPGKLERLRADKEFQYFEEVVQGENWWQRMLRRVAEWLRELFYQGQTSGFWEFLIYAFLVVAIVFIIIKLLKVDVTGFFGRKAKAAEIPYHVFEENINEMNLAALIDKAITQHEYRKAIRLHYLQSLKNLTDADYINWKPGKTNRSYIAEIQHPCIRQEFEHLTGMFEYVWYGGAGLGADLFDNARQEFLLFDNLLKQQA